MIGSGPVHGSPEWQELLVLHAFALLEAAERAEVEAHVRRCSECAVELAGYAEVLTEIAQSRALSQPRDEVRAALLARISTPSARGVEQPLPGMFVLRDDAAPWRPTPFPGVTYKSLYVDPTTRMTTSLLRLEPGAAYPPHRHTAVEQCLVLKGDVRLGPIALQAGDFEYALDDTCHGAITTESGCTLLIVSSPYDELLAH